MRARATIVNPDSAELTLELTMTVKQWKDLDALLPSQWPGWPVASMIRQAIDGTRGNRSRGERMSADQIEPKGDPEALAELERGDVAAVKRRLAKVFQHDPTFRIANEGPIRHYEVDR